MAEGGLRVWPLVRLPYRLARAMLSLAVDMALGVKTTILANDITIRPGPPPLFEHIPTGWLTVWRTLRRLDIGDDDVLYDVGAGSGRVLLVAGRFPFRRLVGIELSPALHALARANLARSRLPARMPVELIRGDAVNEPFPTDATVVFFYNAFDGDTLDRFVDHMLDAVTESPRRLRFVYHNPVEHERLVATGRFDVLDRMHGLRPGREWSRMLSTYFYEVRST